MLVLKVMWSYMSWQFALKYSMYLQKVFCPFQDGLADKPCFAFCKIFTVLIFFFLLKNQISKQEDSLSPAIIEAEAGVQAEAAVAASKGVFLIPGLT